MSSHVASRRPFLPLTFVAGAVVSALACFPGLSACGSGGQCALDSDCALGLRCNAAHQCVARGAGDVDAAVVERTDSGPRGDAGPDAPGARDAFSVDAFVPMDAPMDDANVDAAIDAFDDCPAIGGAYTVSRSGLICMSSATTVTFTRLAGCEYDVMSDQRGDVQGVMSYAGGTFSGGISFPDVSRICTLDLSAAPDIRISCGMCSLDLVPAM